MEGRSTTTEDKQRKEVPGRIVTMDLKKEVDKEVLEVTPVNKTTERRELRSTMMWVSWIYNTKLLHQGPTRSIS